MSLLERLRNEIGLAMGGSYPAREIVRENELGEKETMTTQMFMGWTTDEAKADAAREAGAVVTRCPSSEPDYSGWDVAVTEIRA